MRFACIFLISALISNTKLFCQEISLVDATINGDAHNTLANSAATKNSEEGITSQHEEGEAKELLLDKSAESEIGPIHAEFSLASNLDIVAELFWEDASFGNLMIDLPIEVNTFPGHEWTAKYEGKIIQTWVVEDEPPHQVFTLEDHINVVSNKPQEETVRDVKTVDESGATVAISTPEPEL